jgi:hypothetical protein
MAPLVRSALPPTASRAVIRYHLTPAPPTSKYRLPRSQLIIAEIQTLGIDCITSLDTAIDVWLYGI